MPEPTKGEATLTEFIEGNHKLLSVLGVIVALVVFSRSLILGTLVQFGFLSCAVLLVLELAPRFKNAANWRLNWFQLFLFFAGLGILFEWAVDLERAQGVTGVFVAMALLIWLAMVGVLTGVLRLARLPQRMTKWKGTTRGSIVAALGVVIVIAMALASVSVARRMSGPVAKALDGAVRDSVVTVSSRR